MSNSLVKLREYTVESHDRTMQVNIPSVWLRDKTVLGDSIGLFQEPESGRLIIDIINPEKTVNKKTQ